MRSRAAFGVCAALFAACASQQSNRLDLGPVPPGVTVDAHVRYYDFSAASLTEVRRAMLQLGPRSEGRPWQAVTQSRFNWTYESERRGLACGTRRVRVKMTTDVVFPRWSPSAEPDSAMLEWWRRLNAGLIEHERGHALISLHTAGEIVRAMENVTTTCGDLGNQIASINSRLIKDSQAKQVEYDFTTRHGAVQVQQAGRLRDP